jgi:hypothetical protein
LVSLNRNCKISRKGPTEDEKSRSKALHHIVYGDGDVKGGTTISALWNMRENIKYVQNLLGTILDYIESIKNLFIWVSPNKVKQVLLIQMNDDS